MLNRSNLFLALLLILQVVLLAILVLLTGGGESRQIEAIWSGNSTDEIERVTIVDDLDNEVIFARAADGWVLPNADDFPINSEKVEEILGKIAGMNTSRLVASNPANFARLEVKDDDFRRKITLENGDSSQTLYLGGSGGVDNVYVRRAGEDNVYLGIGLNSWELSTQISTWIDANYVNLSQDDLLEVTVQNAQGSFTLLRIDDNWTYTDLPADETLEDTKIPGILRNAATIRMVEPLGLEALDEFALAEPQVIVEVRYRQLVEAEEPATLETEDDNADDDQTTETEAADPELQFSEKSYTLSFGAELEDGVVLKSSAEPYYVLVRDTVLSAFSTISQDDFIKAPEAEVQAEPSG